MNRFEEYLNGLDKKNLIMLYLSIIIAVGVIYYNYNYSVLQDKIEQNNNEIHKLLQKSKKSHSLNKKLVSLKKEYKNLQKTHESLVEDLRYLNLLINTSPILKLTDKKILNILRDILQYAIDNNIVASYEMQFVSGDYNNYIINIKGSFDVNDFMNFYKFIKSVESMNAIKEIKMINFQKKENVEFTMQIYFWGLK